MFLIMEKAEAMKKYIKELKDLSSGMSYDEFQNNAYKRYAIERLVQLIIDLAVDINNMILSYLKKPNSKDYFNSFIEIGEQDVIPIDFAVKIAPSTGMRNRLVHQYEDINEEIIYNSIEDTINNFQKYLCYIDKFTKNP